MTTPPHRERRDLLTSTGAWPPAPSPASAPAGPGDDDQGGEPATEDGHCR